MKKWILIISILCLLTGCSAAEQTKSPSTPANTKQNTTTQQDPTQQSNKEAQASTGESQLETISFTLYVPNETWDGLEHLDATIPELNPHLVLQQLQNAGVINAEAAVLSVVVDGNNMLTLDLNEAFLTQLCALGSTGEGMLMSSLVNTFLSAYGCDCMMVTVEGQTIHSGHVDYDFPMYGITDSN